MEIARVIPRLHRDESGQDLIEYALVMLTVVLAAIAGSGSMASLLSNSITALSTKINTAIS